MSVKCLLVSFFNSNNVGDLLISAAINEELTKSGLKVIKCSYEGSFDIRGSLQSSIVRPLYTFGGFFQRVVLRIKLLSFWHRYRAELAKVDIVIMGGGNMIMDLLPNTRAAAHFRKYIVLAKKADVKVIAWSIGVGPFQTEEQASDAISALEMCDYVTLRDGRSYALVAGASKDNIFLAVDPVFMMSRQIKKEVSMPPIVGVGVIEPLLFGYTQERRDKVIHGYIELIAKLLKEDKRVVLFSTECADYSVAEALVKQFSNSAVSISHIDSADHLLEFYGSLSFLISARMHSLIVAFTQGVPFYALVWQEKVHGMLDLIGKAEFSACIDQLPGKVEAIIDCMRNSVVHHDASSDDKLVQIRSQYSINQKLLRRVIG